MSRETTQPPRRVDRRLVVALAVVAAALVGGVALTGAAMAAENVHDGTLEDPSTGEPVQSVNGGEKTKIRYGYEVDNVSDTGESVYLFLAFPNEVNSTSGLGSPGSFQVDVTCKCGGNPESVSVSSSPTVADGPDGDGVQEMIKVGIQPSKRDKPIDIVVNMTGPATYPNVTQDTTYDLRAYVEESISSGQDTNAVFEDVTVTADGSGSDGTSGDDGGSGTDGSDGSDGGSGTDDQSSDEPSISNYEVTADGDRITVTFDSDETLADIRVDVRGAEDGALTTADFDGNQYEGYRATYTAGATGEYTLELVTAEGSGGDNGATSGEFTETVSVSDTGEDGPTDDTTTPTDDGGSTDGSTTDGDATDDDGTSNSDGTDGSTPTDDGSGTDDGSSDDGGTDDDQSSTQDESSTADGSGDSSSTTESGDGSGAADGADTADQASGDDGTPAEGDGAGFGAGLAVASILAGALLATRLR